MATFLRSQSIGALRMVVALVVLATILGIYFLARELADTRIAIFAVLLATLAPWSFQAGRVFWKCPLAPMFVVWGVYFFFLGLRGRNGASMALSAGLFSLALYSYQSAWAQVPLMGLVLFALALRDRAFALKAIPVFCVTGLVLCIPLLVLIVHGDLMKRAADVSVFSRGTASGALLFVRNYAMHLDPRFLFLHGDQNLRHSVAGLGQLGWLDAAAWIVGLATLVSMRKLAWPRRRLLLVAGVGLLAGVVPAAMPNEGIPHALRANGMWPFAALLGAWFLGLHKKVQAIDAGVAGIGLIFLVVSMSANFSTHAARAAPYFPDKRVNAARSAIADGSWSNALATMPKLEARFYMMSLAGLACAQSAELAR